MPIVISRYLSARDYFIIAYPTISSFLNSYLIIKWLQYCNYVTNHVANPKATLKFMKLTVIIQFPKSSSILFLAKQPIIRITFLEQNQN